MWAQSWYGPSTSVRDSAQTPSTERLYFLGYTGARIVVSKNPYVEHWFSRPGYNWDAWLYILSPLWPWTSIRSIPSLIAFDSSANNGYSLQLIRLHKCLGFVFLISQYVYDVFNWSMICVASIIVPPFKKDVANVFSRLKVNWFPRCLIPLIVLSLLF